MGRPNVAVVLFLAFVAAPAKSQENSRNLQIEHNTRNLLVNPGQKLVLRCKITPDDPISPADITWHGPPGVSNTTSTMTDTTNDKYTYFSILTLDPFTANHAGEYVCNLRSQQTKITLHAVTEHKVEPEFHYGNRSALLECTLQFPGASESQATFKEWLKDNESLSEVKVEPPTKFIDSENGTLYIENPRRTECGQYTARYEVKLVNEIELVNYDCIVEYTASPLVLDMVKSNNIIEGDTLQLECEIIGYPHANVTWLKDGQILVPDGNHIKLEEFKDYEDTKLVIVSASAKDAGNYTCVATDEQGRSNSKSIRVRVKDQLEWLWPVVGILCELAVLSAIIFICSKVKKNDSVDKPADEREGLLRQGSGRKNE